MQDDRLRRQRVEEVVFPEPLVGRTGVALVAYSWPSRLEEFVDRRGEDRVRRVSDWEQSQENADTGRQVVHQFSVRLQDGSERTVSAESAAELLGMPVTTLRAGARRMADQAITKARALAAEVAAADRLDDLVSAATPARAVADLITTYIPSAPMIRRMAENGPRWAERDASVAKSERYRFLVREGGYVWSPEIVKPESELARRGWATQEFMASEIWDQEGQDRMHVAASERMKP